MAQENFKQFNKLKNRYWKFKNTLEISEVVRDFTNKINNIENRDLGPGDDFKITTEARVIINGLALKIYYFLKHSIIYTDDKQYISAIALSRLCLEHLVMMSLFQTRLSSYIQDNDFKSLIILLHSFSMGQRIMFKYVDKEDKGQKRFASRAEHVSEALRQFDKKYGGGVQLLYDLYSEHSHVSPTSAVRMLYRQEKWDTSEPVQNFYKVRLSSISNANEKLACGGIETLLTVYENVKINTIDKENEIAKVLESKGKQLELNQSLNPNYHDDVWKVIIGHDKMVEEFQSKLRKYIDFK